MAPSIRAWLICTTICTTITSHSGISPSIFPTLKNRRKVVTPIATNGGIIGITAPVSHGWRPTFSRAVAGIWPLNKWSSQKFNRWLVVWPLFRVHRAVEPMRGTACFPATSSCTTLVKMAWVLVLFVGRQMTTIPVATSSRKTNQVHWMLGLSISQKVSTLRAKQSSTLFTKKDSSWMKPSSFTVRVWMQANSKRWRAKGLA